jgi:hypothetical protein
MAAALCAWTAGAGVRAELQHEGRISLWATAAVDPASELQAGARYIPALSVSRDLSAHWTLDALASINAEAFAVFDSGDREASNSDVDPYRLWIRFSSRQLEIRAGLQKISFGSASLLRPLMWFDRVDPRDPTGLTDGVYSLLGRYYMLNNANMWLWCLYGNDETKGWETEPSVEDRPEYGGRVQMPLLGGEMGVSLHRRVLQGRSRAPEAAPGISRIDETRVGVDGRWDIEVGCWFEAVLTREDRDTDDYRRFLNVGLDYTVNVGNGLNVVAEHFVAETAREAFGSGDGASFSAAALNYPVGVVDSVKGIFYHEWDAEEWYRYIDWQRTFDNWTLHLIGFWNPDERRIREGEQAGAVFAGKGIQLTAIFNH